MKKARIKSFIVLCSALIDAIIVAFCTYFNNDSIGRFKPVPSSQGSIGGLSPSKFKYEAL